MAAHLESTKSSRREHERCRGASRHDRHWHWENPLPRGQDAGRASLDGGVALAGRVQLSLALYSVRLFALQLRLQGGQVSGTQARA